MTDLSKITGLPDELDSFQNIAKEGQQITATIEKKKFGKKYTIIKGINGEELDLEELAKKLKRKFACGGTVKKNKIELQGDHLSKVREVLVKEGFPPETIKIK